MSIVKRKAVFYIYGLHVNLFRIYELGQLEKHLFLLGLVSTPS